WSALAIDAPQFELSFIDQPFAVKTVEDPALDLSHNLSRTQFFLAHGIDQNGVEVHPVAAEDIGEKLVADDDGRLRSGPQDLQSPAERPFSGFNRIGDRSHPQRAGDPHDPAAPPVGGNAELKPLGPGPLDPLPGLGGNLIGFPCQECVIQIHDERPETPLPKVVEVDVEYAPDALIRAKQIDQPRLLPPFTSTLIIPQRLTCSPRPPFPAA